MPTLTKGNNVYRLSQGTYGAASATLLAPTENHAGSGADEDAEEEETLPILPPSLPISSPIPPTSELDIAVARPSSNAFTSHPSTSTLAPSKCKRSALSALQNHYWVPARKHAPTAAMNSIKESIDSFNVTFFKSVLVQPECMHPDSSPEHWAKAVELIQVQEDYLTDD